MIRHNNGMIQFDIIIFIRYVVPLIFYNLTDCW